MASESHAELEKARASHAATMARLKGATGREAEQEITRSARALMVAHRTAAVEAVRG
jgi:hypothetical protein